MATHSTVTARARLRSRSQLTLPETIVTEAGIGEGDRFMVVVTPDEPDTIRLHRMRDG